MASNPFDQFDAADSNPFDQFDAPAKPAAVPVKGDYRNRYDGQNLVQGNLNYLKDYISGIGKAATTERPADFSSSTPAGGIAGVGEAALNLGSSALSPLFALPDWAITKLGVPDKRNPSGTYAGAKSKYIYEPRTAIGKTGSEFLSAALKPVGDVFSLIGSGYGDIAGQFGASPETQNEIRDIAPDVVSAGLTIGQLRSMNKGPQQQPIPTTEELRQAKQQAYKTGSASSVLTSPEQNAAAIAKIDDALKSENIIVDPDLHPKSSALLRRLQAQKNQPLTVPEAESLRQLALEVQRDIDPVTKQPTADAFRAGVILDELDNSLDTLSVNQGARALNARFRRSQLIDEMIHRAEIKAGANYTQAGMEHALRNEFKQLALNPRRMRGLTLEQKAAIEKVAKGGPIENSLRTLGKFDPTTGGMAAFIGTGTGSMVGTALAGLTGGGIGALAVPALGFLGKRGATKMTARNVDLAREALVGRQQVSAPAPGLLGARAAPASAGILGARTAAQIRQDLTALDASMRSLPPDASQSSPQVAALRAEWERLQAELAAAESASASP